MSKKISRDALMHLIANWNKKSADDIARELGVGVTTVTKWAAGLRTRGVDLPKRTRTDFYLDQVAKEAKQAEAMVVGGKQVVLPDPNVNS